MIVKLLTEHHLEFLSLKGGCRGPSESTLVKLLHCWKSHVTAHIFFQKHYLHSSDRYVAYETQRVYVAVLKKKEIKVCFTQ